MHNEFKQSLTVEKYSLKHGVRGFILDSSKLSSSLLLLQTRKCFYHALVQKYLTSHDSMCCPSTQEKEILFYSQTGGPSPQTCFLFRLGVALRTLVSSGQQLSEGHTMRVEVVEASQNCADEGRLCSLTTLLLIFKPIKK